MDERRAQQGGAAFDETAAWSPSELILATQTRIPIIKGGVFAFKMGVQKLADIIWTPAELKAAFSPRADEGGASNPQAETEEGNAEEGSDQGEAPNATNDQVLLLLKAAPRRVRALLDSAARAGAETALQATLSWYPKLNLDALSAMRKGAEAAIEAAYTRINHLAADMACWFDHTEFRPYLDDEGMPISPMSVADLASSSTEATQSGPSNRPAPASSSPLYQRTSDEDEESSGSSSQSSEERPVDPATTTTSPAASVADQAPPTAPEQAATVPPLEASMPPSGEQTAPTPPSA